MERHAWKDKWQAAETLRQEARDLRHESEELCKEASRLRQWAQQELQACRSLRRKAEAGIQKILERLP
jgi:hypothetical protein